MKWLLANWDQVLIALGQHLVIASTSIAIAFILSLLIGIWAARYESVFRVALTVTGLLYTIPTLAFLALLIPVVGLGRAKDAEKFMREHISDALDAVSTLGSEFFN